MLLIQALTLILLWGINVIVLVIVLYWHRTSQNQLGLLV